jgi:hypothetical protein
LDPGSIRLWSAPRQPATNGERSIDEPPWECPECHDLWEPQPTEPTNPARSYTFLRVGGYPGPTAAEWVRIGPATF